MLPNTNIPFNESVAPIANALKRSELYIDAIRSELIEKNNLSKEGDVIIRSLMSKLEQASEMSSIDKFKNWYDSDYIKDTIKERIEDKNEQTLLLGAFDSLRDSLIQSASVTSILTGQLRKSIGSIAGLFTSQMDLPPIVTFMTTRFGDMFGSFLQRRKDNQERRDALTRKLDDAVVEENKPKPEQPREPIEERPEVYRTPIERNAQEYPSSQLDDIKSSIEATNNSINKLTFALAQHLGIKQPKEAQIIQFLNEVLPTITNDINQQISEFFKEPKVVSALQALGGSIENPKAVREMLERAIANLDDSSDIIQKVEQNAIEEQKETVNVQQKEQEEAHQEKIVEALNEIADNTEKTAELSADKKNEPEGILGKVFSGLMTGFSALFSGLGKILSAIIPNSILSLARSIIPSLSSLLASPAVMASIAAGSYLLFNKYAHEHNTELDKAGLAAANPDEITNSSDIDPSAVLNEKGQEEYKEFVEKNKFVEMSIADQLKLGIARVFGDEDTVKEITEKYKVDHFKTEKEKTDFYQKQIDESKATYEKIDLIPHISSDDLEKISNSNINILELDKKELGALVDKRLGAGAAVAISPSSVSTNNTNINNSNVVNQSTFMSRPIQLMDPQTLAAMGSSLR